MYHFDQTNKYIEIEEYNNTNLFLIKIRQENLVISFYISKEKGHRVVSFPLRSFCKCSCLLAMSITSAE